MEQWAPRTTAAMPWLLLLCLAAVAATSAVLQAHAQSGSKGFISIDCGLPVPEETGYFDNTTTLSFVTDTGFIDAGLNHNIAAQYITSSGAKVLHTLRSFPTGMRNCYTFSSLESGRKYLIRAMFMYGNYDGLNRLPVFDLLVGVNLWKKVHISELDKVVITEAMVIVPDDFLQVCLVNTGAGTPFISGLDLRPLENALYPQVNATWGLVMLYRLNFRSTAAVPKIIRYPDDPHDRLWLPWVDTTDWTEISTTTKVQKYGNDLADVPTAVIQTAVVPQNASKNIEFTLDLESQANDTPSLRYITIMHFCEPQQINSVREYYININGQLWNLAYKPPYLYSSNIYNYNDPSPYSSYNVSLNATANSKLPPIINAFELFYVISTADVGTNSQDVSAITAIKENYQVLKNWMGDPCSPKNLVWVGLTCSYAVSKPPIIRSLNLSFSDLNGAISSSFANLKNVQYLNLSNNNLIGPIPDALSQLPSLTLVDLSNNKLNGSIPSGLLKRIQDGSLNLRYGNNPDLCTNGNSCQVVKKNKLAIYIVVPVVSIAMIVLVAVLLYCLLRRRKQGSINDPVKINNEMMISTKNDAYGDSSLQLENRRFTYKELEMITTNFQRVLGQGGFGYVYHGFLEDGTEVAVKKMLSRSSNQGVKEFLVEAQILTRIHHKNLVNMIGYCKDGECMALVCEYMPEGNLQEYIAGKDRKGGCLPWRRRLRIALESAQGLEYLHKGCNPPLLHRDVKASNILLNTRLEAKIADFGLSKAFSGNTTTNYLSTNTLVGTPGYVDPEYQATMQPSTKSDVYSFGVVLLELITGKPAILRDPEPTSVIRWSRKLLARGDIEGVVDVRMRGDYDVNSVWKVADIALRCTEQASLQRPSMSDVVAQLQECLELEEDRVGVDANGELHTGSSSSGLDPYMSYNSYTTYQSSEVSQISSTMFDKEHNFTRVPTMDTGAAAR